MLKDEHKLPVDVRGSKTSVLKLAILNSNSGALCLIGGVMSCN